jgi:hypothetical protein
MNDFLNSPTGYYVFNIVLNVLLAGAIQLIHKGKANVESSFATILPQEDVVKVNDVLDAIDSMAEAAVNDFGNQIVNGLKANNLFTTETAASVKQAAVTQVLKNLGPLQEKAVGLIGPLQDIVGQYIEKHVNLAKAQSK